MSDLFIFPTGGACQYSYYSEFFMFGLFNDPGQQLSGHAEMVSLPEPHFFPG